MKRGIFKKNLLKPQESFLNAKSNQISSDHTSYKPHILLNPIYYISTLHETSFYTREVLKMNWTQQQVQQCVMYNLLMRWPHTTSFISLGWESCQKIFDSIWLYFLVMLSNYFMIYENLNKNEIEDLSFYHRSWKNKNVFW